MKHIVKISLLLAAALLSLACSKEMAKQVSDTPVSVEPFTITVSIPNDMTKVSFTQENKGLDGDKVKLAWSDTDELVIIDNGDASVSRVFSIVPESITDERKTASFVLKTGEEEMFTPSNGKYNILYGAESMEEALTVDFSSQTQDGNADLDHLAGKYIALLEGVNTLEGIKLSNTWAAANGGGTFKETGILRLWLQMPNAIESVGSVIVNAPSAIFYKTNALLANEKVSSLILSFSGNANKDGGDHNTITGYLMLPWQNINFTANTTLSIIVKTALGDFYSRTFTVASGKVFDTGKMNSIKLNDTGIAQVTNGFAGGSGTSADPWLIANVTHMGNISSNLKEGTTYFKMIDDVDMTSFSESLVTEGSKKIDFNGNGKIVLKLDKPMFSALFGSVYNFTIKDADVSVNGNDKGILAQTAGSSTISGDTVAEDISIINSKIRNNNQRTGALIGRLWGIVKTVSTDSNCSVSGAAQTGGLVGRLDTGTIDNCSTAGTVTCSSYYQGGLVGMVEGGTIKCCSSSATVTNNLDGTYSRCGGLVGLIEAGTVLISYCHTTGNVSATVSGKGSEVGGLIGQVAPASGKTITLTVEKSYATGDVSNNGYNRVGGLIGEISGGASASITDCYYSGTILSSNYSGGYIGLVDGETTSVTITRGYTNATITSAGVCVGVLCHAGNGTVTCSNFVGWNTSGKTFSTGSSAPAAAGNYYGTSGTIYSQAVTLGGWDFDKVWTTDDTPLLRPYVAE